LGRLAAALGAFSTVSASFASLFGNAAAAQRGETGTKTALSTTAALSWWWLVLILLCIHWLLLLVLLRATILRLAIGLGRVLLGRVLPLRRVSLLWLTTTIVLLVRHLGDLAMQTLPLWYVEKVAEGEIN